MAMLNYQRVAEKINQHSTTRIAKTDVREKKEEEQKKKINNNNIDPKNQRKK